jgi:FkbM family methyltransferase
MSGKTSLHYSALRLMLHSVQMRRQVVERIDSSSTVVLLLGVNLQIAILHYARYSDPLPEFYVIDHAQYLREIEFVTRNSPIVVHSALNLPSRLDRAVCIYAPERVEPWTPGRGFLPTFYAAVQAGVLPRNVLFPAYVFADHMSWIVQEPLHPGYFQNNCDAITRGYAAMGDADSKAVYAAGIQMRITGDSGYMPFSSYPQYYHPLVNPKPGDLIIEGGVEWGETSVKFAESVGDSGTVIAFEPDPNVHQSLQERFMPHKNIQLERQGLWSSKSLLNLEVKIHGGSRVAYTSGEHTVPCPLIDIDTYMEQSGLDRCDMIKLDIEGAELETLKGSVRTLRKYRPKLAISVYHYPYEQFVDIVQFLLEIDLGYALYMGHHLPACYETVLYGHSR